MKETLNGKVARSWVSELADGTILAGASRHKDGLRVLFTVPHWNDAGEVLEALAARPWYEVLDLVESLDLGFRIIQ